MVKIVLYVVAGILVGRARPATAGGCATSPEEEIVDCLIDGLFDDDDDDECQLTQQERARARNRHANVRYPGQR